MRKVAIIQARNGSTRLPRKSMLPLAGRPLLYRFIERVKEAKLPDEIVLATTEKEEDDLLCDIAEEGGIKWFRGSENDLVDRFYQCAKEYEADVIVRLCADNPLIEPVAIDVVILTHQFSDKETMFSNAQDIKHSGFPDGIGAEVYSFGTMEWLWNNVKDEEQREHPHLYFYRNDLVEPCRCPDFLRYPEVRLDVNTIEDYKFIESIYDKYGPHCHFTDYIGDINGRRIVA